MWLFLNKYRDGRAHFDLSYLSYDGERHELFGDNYLPKEPMPIALTDWNGRTRWTVYIPERESFPLRPSVYAGLCSKSEKLAVHLAASAGHNILHRHKHDSEYYYTDKNFMDVKDAEDHGLLPERKLKPEDWSRKSAASTVNSVYTGDYLNTTKESTSDKICEKSLTYVLESNDAGFGNTLMGLWMAYGLAMIEHRAFFIDDSHW